MAIRTAILAFGFHSERGWTERKEKRRKEKKKLAEGEGIRDRRVNYTGGEE